MGCPETSGYPRNRAGERTVKRTDSHPQDDPASYDGAIEELKQLALKRGSRFAAEHLIPHSKNVTDEKARIYATKVAADLLALASLDLQRQLGPVTDRAAVER
jgi:hypothetical protein